MMPGKDGMHDTLTPVDGSASPPRRMSVVVIGGMRGAERRGDLIDVTPGAMPVISAADQIPGLFIATGLSGHGFGLGPGAGPLMADLALGKLPVVGPAPFQLRRFARAASACRVKHFDHFSGKVTPP